MMTKISNVLVVICILSGCKNSEKHDLKNSLLNRVYHECNFELNSGCIIPLKEVTKFKWEKMFVFGSWTMPDSIENAIKIKYNGDYVPDDLERILFTLENKIIYEEDLETIDYDHSIIEIDFPDVSDSLNRSSPNYYTPSTALFKVKKNEIEGGRKGAFEYNLMRFK